MRSIIKFAIRACVGIPAKLLRRVRNYAFLSESLSTKQPRILIIACHWIGDTLWAAQVVPHLRKHFPEAYLCTLTKPVCAPLWTGSLSVDKIIESNSVVSDRKREKNSWLALRKLGRELASDNWDLIIDLTGNRYSAVLSHLVNARHTLGFDGGEFASLYATHVDNAERPGRHLSERPFRVIESLISEFAYEKVNVPPQPKESYAEACVRHGLDPTKPLAVIAPGAGWPKKEWGDDRFSALIAKFLEQQMTVVLIDSLSKADRLNEVKSSIDNAGSNIQVVAETSIDSALALLSGCSLFVGNDSGLGHVAGTMERLTVSIFTGETATKLCEPYGVGCRVFNANNDNSAAEQVAEILTLIKMIN